MDEKLVDEAPAPAPAPAPEPDAEAGEIVIPDYAPKPQEANAGPAAPLAGGGGGGGAGFAEKALMPISIAPQNDSAEAQEAARLQGDVYNITFWMIVVQAVRLAVKLLDHYGVDMGTGNCQAGASDCVQDHSGGKGAVDWKGGLIEVYCYATVFALAWFGAKHLDSTLMLLYVASSGFCCIVFVFVTIGVFEELASPGEPLTGVERDVCLRDPDCDVNDNEQRHILNQLGLLALQVLFALGVWKGVQLYRHPMTNSEKRVPDRLPDAEATALGGGDAPARAPGFFEKFFVVRVNADPNAADPNGAAEAARLQTILYNIVFYSAFFELLRVGLKVFILGTEDSTTAWIELYCIFCPFVLGYAGAKHRDSQIMWSYIVTGGFCFVSFIPSVTLLIVQNAFEAGDELEADEKAACAIDPNCDPATATKELNHPLDSIPLLMLQVLFGAGVYYAYALARHPSAQRSSGSFSFAWTPG